MHPTYASGGKQANACSCSNDHGTGYGSCSNLPRSQGQRHIPPAQLAHRFCGGQCVEFLVVQPHFVLASHHRNGGRYRTLCSDDLLQRTGGFHVLRIRHTVGNDRGLQGHYSTASIQCFGHFRGEVQGWKNGAIHGQQS